MTLNARPWSREAREQRASGGRGPRRESSGVAQEADALALWSDDPPASAEPASAPLRCPKCGQPMKQREAARYFRDGPFEDQMSLWFDDVVVRVCWTCNLAGAQVPGIQTVWREDCDDLPMVLAQDALEGLRQRHFLNADMGDPMFGAGGFV